MDSGGCSHTVCLDLAREWKWASACLLGPQYSLSLEKKTVTGSRENRRKQAQPSSVLKMAADENEASGGKGREK